MERVRRHVVVVIVGAAVFRVGCGKDEDSNGPADTTVPTSSTVAAGATATQASGAALPGERVEIYPYGGARLAVVGVATGDTLKVRSGPGVQFAVIADLTPLAANAVATGHNRSLGDAGFWSEVTVDGMTGTLERLCV